MGVALKCAIPQTTNNNYQLPITNYQLTITKQVLKVISIIFNDAIG